MNSGSKARKITNKIIGFSLFGAGVLITGLGVVLAAGGLATSSANEESPKKPKNKKPYAHFPETAELVSEYESQ